MSKFGLLSMFRKKGYLGEIIKNYGSDYIKLFLKDSTVYLI